MSAVCVWLTIVRCRFQFKNWDVLPRDKPLISAYVRASGLEVFFADIYKDTIDSIIGVRENKITYVNIKDHVCVQDLLHADLLRSDLQAFRPSAGKESPLWAAVENLQKGVSWHRTKPFLIVEARYFQATTLGLPLEISKYYESVNGITVNGEEPNPTPDESN